MEKLKIIRSIFDILKKTNENLSFYCYYLNKLPYHLLLIINKDFNISINQDIKKLKNSSLDLNSIKFKNQSLIINTASVITDVELNKGSRIEDFNDYNYIVWGDRVIKNNMASWLYLIFNRLDKLIDLLNSLEKVYSISNSLYYTIRWREKFINILELESSDYIEIAKQYKVHNVMFRHTIGYWMIQSGIDGQIKLFKKICAYQLDVLKEIKNEDVDECLDEVMLLISNGSINISFLRYKQELECTRDNFKRLLAPISLSQKLNTTLFSNESIKKNINKI